MARILLLLVIAFVIYLLFRGFFRAQVKRDAPPPAKRVSSGADQSYQPKLFMPPR